MVKLYYVRHGQAQHNLLYNEIGKDAYLDPRVIDSSLTGVGIGQAQQLRNQCDLIAPISIILVSPLTRCLETTEEMMHGFLHKPRVIALDELIEWAATDTPNHRKPVSMLRERFPFVDFTNIQSDRSVPLSDSIYALQERIDAFRSFVTSLGEDERIMVVGHTSWFNKLIFNIFIY